MTWCKRKVKLDNADFWGTFHSFFLLKFFFHGSCHFCGHTWPSLNEYVGFKKIFWTEKQPKKKKMDHKIEEKMSHGIRNGTFKAPLTLKKIKCMSAKERVLTPSVWWYLTFFWWQYKSILRVSNRGKVEISFLHPKMWFLWENRNFFFFWTLYSQGTLLFKIA